MPTKMKRSKTSRLVDLPALGRFGRAESGRARKSAFSINGKLRSTMSTRRNTARANEYVCAIERNQNGKYSVRIRAAFASAVRGSQEGWTLPVYFLASSFNAAMKKLEESLQHLQKNEERLHFWSVERTDDPNFADDLLPEFGLRLDRRREFPRKMAEFGVPRERPVPASTLAPVRRILADSVAQERPVDRSERSVLASD
jgi:hypothetical protein